MKLLKKPAVAIFIMIIAICVSSVLGARRSLLRERRAAEDYFYNGNDDGYSIQSDLEYIGATANNLRTVAARYIDVDDPMLSSLTEARSALADADSIAGKYSAAQALYDAATLVYNSLDPNSMNSTDKSFRASLYDDITSAMQRISHNPYNDVAREFNAVLDGFPANIIAAIVGIEPVQLYN